MTHPSIRLGVNIDHVATVRNARGGAHPDPLRAALLAQEAGADGITAHLREDRRHIRDADMDGLKAMLKIPLNFEMAATADMQAIALRVRPHACCLVPEKREERTTEGGLDVVGGHNHLAPYIRTLNAAGIRVSLFIEPDAAQIHCARDLGAPVIELHTGTYCHAFDAGDVEKTQFELNRLREGVKLAASLGLEVHAGHGLNFASVVPIAAMTPIRELNIGHFLVGEAIFIGFAASIAEMRRVIASARTSG